ncbi:hypothetical protein B8O08_21530 [Klebsiella variicola]|nr:hypothetical protein B8O08_21530 [Klebsiella variicola]
MAQVLSFQELIKFTAVMRSTCQSWGILHSEKRGKLEDQARGFSRVAAAPYPGYGPCGLPLMYSALLLKLPVLAASTSLRRSRQAGAARRDAG